MNIKPVARLVPAQTTREGAGFIVHRPFPTPQLDHFDPFLLLDEMGPMDLGPGEAQGAPDHPHRGFETVTYLLSGEMQHRDSQGHAGKLTPGDVQWMTAGSGVIHSEMPSDAFLASGGRMHGFQLWVNLPQRDKMITPRYQEISSAGIPTATSADRKSTIRVIAGEAFGTKAAIQTRTPIFYFDVAMAPDSQLQLPVPADFNVFVYVLEGEVEIDRKEVSARTAALLGGGDTIALVNRAGASRLLVIGGVPLREPVARYGPFVMNYRAELVQAIDDFESGRFGQIE